MEYIVEEMESFQVIGVSKEFSPKTSNEKIPQFWNDFYYQNVFNQEMHDWKIGEFGICIDEMKPNGNFNYMIAGRYHGGSIPSGFSIFEFPKMLWAKFRCIGPLPEAIQELTSKIFQEWLPLNKEYVLAKPYSIEWYSDDKNVSSNEAISEVWIPVKKK